MCPRRVVASQPGPSGRRGSSPALSRGFPLGRYTSLRNILGLPFLHECRSGCSHMSGLPLAIHATVCCGLVRRCARTFFARGSQFKPGSGTLRESVHTIHISSMRREEGASGAAAPPCWKAVHLLPRKRVFVSRSQPRAEAPLPMSVFNHLHQRRFDGGGQGSHVLHGHRSQPAVSGPVDT